MPLSLEGVYAFIELDHNPLMVEILLIRRWYVAQSSRVSRQKSDPESRAGKPHSRTVRPRGRKIILRNIEKKKKQNKRERKTQKLTEKKAKKLTAQPPSPVERRWVSVTKTVIL